MKLGNILIILCLFLLTNRAKCLQEEKLIGGNETYPYQFKYQVSLLENGYYKCGGGIIGDKFILTAVHCFLNSVTGKINQRLFTVVAPAVNNDIPYIFKKIYEIEKLYIHRSYQPKIPNPGTLNRPEGDIAIIKLKEDLHLETNEKVAKLLVPQENYTYFGETVVLVSQGHNIATIRRNILTNKFSTFGSSDGKLRYMNTIVSLHSACDISSPNPFFNRFHICAKAKQKIKSKPVGTCMGDSGSPLVRNGDTVIGILISGPVGCHEIHVGSTYTRVSAYSRFIEDAIADKKNPDTYSFTFIKIPKVAKNTNS